MCWWLKERRLLRIVLTSDSTANCSFSCRSQAKWSVSKSVSPTHVKVYFVRKHLLYLHSLPHNYTWFDIFKYRNTFIYLKYERKKTKKQINKWKVCLYRTLTEHQYTWAIRPAYALYISDGFNNQINDKTNCVYRICGTSRRNLKINLTPHKNLVFSDLQ